MGGGNFGYQSYSWIRVGNQQALRHEERDTDGILKNAPSWTLSVGSYQQHDYTIQYCLSQLVEEHCPVQFSMIIMAVTMACNFLKAFCMLLALRLQKSRLLVTLGNAIEDFSSSPTRLRVLRVYLARTATQAGGGEMLHLHGKRRVIAGS